MRQFAQYNAGMLYAMAADTPEYNGYLFSKISFERSKESPRLQVGDLFARETMKAIDRALQKKEPRGSWIALHATGRFHIDVKGETFFLGLKEQLPSLHEKLGTSPEEYIKWLLATGRQDNISNKLLFVGSAKWKP
jgi:hypothetical protein